MGLLDNLGEQAAAHKDKLEDVVDKAGDFVDEKTDDKYSEQVDQAQEFVKDKLDEL